MGSIHDEKVGIEYLTSGRVKMPSINDSWADAHEKNSMLGMLSMELRHNDIGGGLFKGIRPGHVNLVFGDKVKVAVSRRDEDDLLLRAFQEQWHEKVEEMNVANDISFAACEELLFQSGRILSPVYQSELSGTIA